MPESILLNLSTNARLIGQDVPDVWRHFPHFVDQSAMLNTGSAFMCSGGLHVFLIYDNPERRATISYEMSKRGMYVVPFASVEDLAARWPNEGMVLISDDADNVPILAEKMLASEQWLPFIAFSERPEAARIVRAVNEGAVGYSDHPTDIEKLCKTVREARNATGRIGYIRARALKARTAIAGLTRREMQVLEGLADGLTNRAIGEKLFISHRTVELHRGKLLNKLGGLSINAAIRMLMESKAI